MIQVENVHVHQSGQADEVTVIKRTFEVSHCTLYTAHCTLHSAHFTLHTAHCTLHTAHCTLHTAHCTLFTAQDTRYPAECPSLTLSSVGPDSRFCIPLLPVLLAFYLQIRDKKSGKLEKLNSRKVDKWKIGKVA